MAYTSVLYVLDWNVGSHLDDPVNPFRAGRIAVGPATGGELKTLIDHEQMPDGIDVLLEEKSSSGYLVWTQMGDPDKNNGIVQAARLDGTESTTLFSDGSIHTPKQLAIDQVNCKLYIGDREGLRVHRCNLNGSGKEILIRRGDFADPAQRHDKHRQCVGVCVDPANGKFYWTQKGPSKGGEGRIFRANIEMPERHDADTRDDIEMLFDNLPEPIDLAIDSENQLLYWTDRGDFPRGNTLNVANLSDISDSAAAGEQKIKKYKTLAWHLHEAVGLVVDPNGQQIYVSDLGGCVYRYDMEGKSRIKLFEDQGVYTGIALARLPTGMARELLNDDKLVEKGA